MTTTSDPAAEAAKIAHLTLIQGVVGRLGANSFALKALSASFATGAIALAAAVKDASPYLPLAAMLPILIFWVMDARFVRLERGYRRLYDAAREGNAEPYSLDVDPYLHGGKTRAEGVLSWAVGWFYAAVLGAVGAIAWILMSTGACPK